MVNRGATTRKHAGCVPHKRYLLLCQQYDELLARSGNRCEVCRARAEREPWGKLAIDHDHKFGLWAVRGLLCHNCNRTIDRMHADGHPGAGAYLRNAWFLAQGWPLNVPAEPGIGYSVMIPHRKVWYRHEDAWHRVDVRPNIRDYHLIRGWPELVHLAGTHNMLLLAPDRHEIRWTPLLDDGSSKGARDAWE
ncbi:endonuclease domain-containing protein [Micromonospora tulbaghiae]|uniref:endonuclease domain-containing protein n=1 Tax=Micromonospora tulbaghiae TaxID=479978 RepID=UPI0033E67C2E